MDTYTTFGQYQGRTTTNSLFGGTPFEPIVFRKEQEDAILKALEHFCTSSGPQNAKVYTPYTSRRHFLWNAKMRFGKTLCAHELNRRMGVGLTLIVTHRPDVIKGWYEEFNKIFGEDKQYIFASRMNVNLTSAEEESYDQNQRLWNVSFEEFNNVIQEVHNGNRRLIFFVSMQYLRRSTLVGGDNDELLKQKILKTDWDLIIIDEAHEGTQTDLGKNVISQLFGDMKTKCLHLSGTPFNLYEEFEDNEIYTWDYIKEQRAKREWPKLHPGEYNPYAELPHMNIFTYNLGDLMQNYIQKGQEFKFFDFFQVWTGNPNNDKAIMPSKEHIGRFIHEDDVNAFLDLLCKKDDENNFPFSTDEYRECFRHTLWFLPGVPQAKAMKNLLQQHKIFRRFNVINVAGEGDKDEARSTALDSVLKAIGETPERTNTITLSCARLTTGVTVKPWTAVLYMRGSENTSPSTYMQTIFRVQSPWVNKEEGWMKEECYVFDFLPNRMLNAITETAKFASLTQSDKRKASTTDSEVDKANIKEFLEYCNVIALKGGKMSPYKAEDLFKRLHEVYIDRLVRNGFDDQCLYVQEELNKIDPNLINEIGQNGGKAPDEKREEAKKTEPIDLGHMTPEQRAKWEENIRQKKAEAKKKAEEKARKDEEFKKLWESWSEEKREEYLQKQAEKEAEREEKRKQREEFRKRITNIRGIALRIPLLMYGGADAGDTSEDLTVDNFTRKIKDESWAEFMPPKVKKTDFNKIKKCFNATRFEEAGKRIRALAREADEMHIDERIERITWIFSTFRNPDKETVLTPWKVVNMQMSNTLGGYCFFNNRFDGPNQIEIKDNNGNILDTVDTIKPRFVSKGDVTQTTFGKIAEGVGIASRILEINSKTGLYPLYVTYTMYRRLLKYYDEVGILDNPIDNLSVSEEHAIWDDVVSKNIYVICNTPMAAGITRRTLMGFRELNKKFNIKSDKLIERAREDRNGLINQIKSVGYWNGTTNKTMINFDAVVGNPPYNILDGGAGASATPIYNHFVGISKELNPNYISMITPSRWFAGGKGLDSYRETMKSDRHIYSMFNFINGKECFPKSSTGSVNYFLWDKNYDGDCEFHTIHNGQDDKMIRSLNEFNVVIANNKAISILHKIHAFDEPLFSENVKPYKPFGLRSYVRGQNIKFDGCLLLHSSEGESYINKDEVTACQDIIKHYKIMTSKLLAEHAGEPDKSGRYRVLSRTEIINPDEICTESYLILASSPDRNNIENCLSYCCTRFFRFLLFQCMSSINMTKDVFCFVPDQDYTEYWSDDKLYKKYGLTEDEIEYIESIIKPMEVTLFDLEES